MAKEVNAHTVAIIEYEERLAGLLTQFFHIKGFNIGFIAYDEKDALTFLSNSDPMPGIIVLDHRDHVMNGIKLMKEIHECKTDIKIIFLAPDHFIEEEAMDSGAAVFLKKPLDISDVDQAVIKILSRSNP